MSSFKVLVNGASIDRVFFEENVQEAKTYTWTEQPMAMALDHGHCIVCTITIPNSQSDKFFVSEGLLLCDSCYKNHLGH